MCYPSGKWIIETSGMMAKQIRKSRLMRYIERRGIGYISIAIQRWLAWFVPDVSLREWLVKERRFAELVV